MKLVKLTSNKPSFKTVEFNPSGITLIVGKKESNVVENKKKTYNAVGKTLIINIIHFCLGANVVEEFVQGLPEWIFTLDFTINDVPYSVSRAMDKADVLIMNGEELRAKNFNQKMFELTFLNTYPNASVSFRGLLQRFIRRNKAAYSYAEKPVKDEQPYNQLSCNAFLLGLDVNLVVEKHELKVDLDNNEKLKKNIENDPVLHEFYTSNQDVDIELAFLNDQLDKLEKNLSLFEVAEDFHSIKKSADDISELINTRENKRQILEISIENINKSLKIKSDMAPDFVYKTFEEAKLKLSDHITKQIDEVVKFHVSLLEKRKERLSDEKVRLENELKEINQHIIKLGKDLNENLKYLNNHRALDEFIALNNKLTDLRIKAGKLIDYKGLISEYDVRKTNLKRSLLDSHAKTAEYINTIQAELKIIQTTFRGMANEFYEDKPAGISIVSNDGLNQTRFNINPKIQSDTSDGVNEVKIFCYDMTFLKLQKNHKISFIFHDSCLFSDMDPRQRETAFRVAHRISTTDNTQYIATVNQDQLDSFKENMSAEDYKLIIADNIKLELTDKSPETKLLGMNIDLEYS